jgi:hypothetical protein
MGRMQLPGIGSALLSDASFGYSRLFNGGSTTDDYEKSRKVMAHEIGHAFAACHLLGSANNCGSSDPQPKCDSTKYTNMCSGWRKKVLRWCGLVPCLKWNQTRVFEYHSDSSSSPNGTVQRMKDTSISASVENLAINRRWGEPAAGSTYMVNGMEIRYHHVDYRLLPVACDSSTSPTNSLLMYVFYRDVWLMQYHSIPSSQVKEVFLKIRSAQYIRGASGEWDYWQDYDRSPWPSWNQQYGAYYNWSSGWRLEGAPSPNCESLQDNPPNIHHKDHAVEVYWPYVDPQEATDPSNVTWQITPTFRYLTQPGGTEMRYAEFNNGVHYMRVQY